MASDEMIRLDFGEIKLIYFRDGSIWLCKEDGEGMSITREELDRILLAHFNENF